MDVVRVSGLQKRFGKDSNVVDDVSFSVESGILSLLGPSGCGKTTTLRCIAGVEVPDAGKVEIAGQVVTDVLAGVFVPPYERDIGFVFQSYALWPHMSIFNNVAFGLRMKKVGQGEVEKRVKDSLRLVGLEHKIKNYPFELSGGEQQRVALARSIVYNPKVLLLDEPLSNIDAKLRESMRVELKSLLRSLGIASIYVTHDQEEAFIISDRVLVMNKGKVAQEGSPADIYERPKGDFVVDFIGRSNIFHGTLRQRNDGEGEVFVEEIGTALKCVPPAEIKEGARCIVALRPNEISIKRKRPPEQQNLIEGTAAERNYRGSVTDHVVNVGNVKILVTTHRFCPLAEIGETGDKVYVHVPPSAITLAQS
jgi:ABC-type Fe3+/spermidine/putrescine transport system ATPase subunit